MVLDDYSRYILAWKLYPTMAAEYVQDTLDMAIEYANNNGIELLAMPIHPFSKVSDAQSQNYQKTND